ncbi:MAG: phage holin family protein [Clostridia bacterium]|nr:phage holin family protein [Clostridia bacterium]
MGSFTTWLKGAFAAAGAVAGFLLGPIDALFFALAGAMCVDYATGVICAGMRGELSSKAGFKGLLRKVMILALVIVANLADKVVPMANCAFRNMTIMFYIANECLSIFENAVAMGLRVPEKLKQLLVRARDDAFDDAATGADGGAGGE